MNGIGDSFVYTSLDKKTQYSYPILYNLYSEFDPNEVWPGTEVDLEFDNGEETLVVGHVKQYIMHKDRYKDWFRMNFFNKTSDWWCYE